MAIEIERKFLVIGDSWRRHVVRTESQRQGYLSPAGFDARCSVRVRMQGDEAFLNIKEAVEGVSRLEFDYGIPVADAADMLARLCRGPLIEKTRHIVEDAGLTWEIDVFHGDNAGLVVAEVELDDADAVIPHPEWLGREVTDERRYYNVSLVDHPYARWREDERQS